MTQLLMASIFLLTILISFPLANSLRTRPQEAHEPPLRPSRYARHPPPYGMPPHRYMRAQQFTKPPRPVKSLHHSGQSRADERGPPYKRAPTPPDWSSPGRRGSPVREWTPQYREGRDRTYIISPWPAVYPGSGREHRPKKALEPPPPNVKLSDSQITTGLPASALNDRPVIGILTKASKFHIKNYGNDYVLKVYIDFVRMAGAYVMLVQSGESQEYYKEIFQQINGLLLPGGGADVVKSNFVDSTRILFDLAMEANDKGDYFPIWGTCLGFEVMVCLTADMFALHFTDSSNLSLPLTLSSSYNETRMLGKAPQEIIDYLEHENITANFHIKSLLTETYHQMEPLYKFYRIVSTNKGRDGTDFVSTIEAYNYPFFAVQWHPEKPIFIRKPELAISTSEHAIKVGQYFANFFISEARKSHHRFASLEERSRMVVTDNEAYCLPEKALGDFCSACSCCHLKPQHSWSADLCLFAVSCSCVLMFALYVWPTLKIYPNAEKLAFDKFK